MIRTRTQRSAGGRVLQICLLLVAFVAVSLLAAQSAQAALPNVFTVDRSDDPATAGNACTAATAGDCSLRGAINAANATANSGGPDKIEFAIPGAGPHTISPTSELPDITQPVTINGYTESLDEGASPASVNTATTGTNAVLKIELDGSGIAGQPSGINIQTNSTVIRGLVINNFDFNGVGIFGDPAEVFSNTVEGNFIGTDPTGASDLGNSRDGVFENSGGGNTIGGATPAARNLISGNTGRGIIILGGGLNEVQGNLIGTKADGISPLGNDNEGVKIFTPQNSVGGTASGEANTIAFNGLEGVVVSGDDSSTGNRILSNSIHSNSKLGINLTGGTQDVNGVTANDNKDPDAGPNKLQNFPRITSAIGSSGATTIKGTLNSTKKKNFTVQFFASPTSDPSGLGEGQTFLGQRTVKTNKKGKASFTATANQDLSGQFITATATNGATGDTSEFSQAVSAS